MREMKRHVGMDDVVTHGLDMNDPPSDVEMDRWAIPANPRLRQLVVDAWERTVTDTKTKFRGFNERKVFYQHHFNPAVLAYVYERNIVEPLRDIPA